MDLRLYYCFQFLIFEFTLKSATGNETDADIEALDPSDYVQIESSRQNQPTDSLFQLQRKYKLEDFLWTGSGNGPIPSEKDGGLAWEDNGGDDGYHPSLILVTKTMVLFKTVLTTVYPIELTPTLVISASSPTRTPSLPELTPTPSQTTARVTTSADIEPSPTFTFSNEPTATPTTTEMEMIPTPSPDTAAASANPMYWVNTVIKANASLLSAPTLHFNDSLEMNLAKVYASAFKKHLLSSIGVSNKTRQNATSESRPRRRRETKLNEREDLDYEWIFYTKYGNSSQVKLRALATTTMNVSVSMVNITVDEKEPWLSLEYFVIAEGKPVPAASAIQDLSLVSKPEMEELIGYDVIKMAQALAAPDPTHAEISEGRTSPWMLLAVAMMVLVIVLILLLGIVAWKWKQKRIADRILEIERRSPSPSSMGVEGGVINPTFIRSPRYEYNEKEVGPGTSAKAQGGFSGQSGHHRTSTQKSLAKNLNERLEFDAHQGRHRSPPSNAHDDLYFAEMPTSSGSEESLEGSSIIVKSRKGSESLETQEHPEVVKPPSPRKRAKTALRRRAEHKGTERHDVIDEKSKSRPLSASSREKVTFGHLDASDDPIAKPISNEAKKLMPSRQPSAKPRSTLSKAVADESNRGIRQDPISEGASIEDDDGESLSNSIYGQDREIGESMGSSSRVQNSSPKKDAQVQTPVRLRGVMKRRPKAKPRRFNATKKSVDSLISTESEEIIQVVGLDDSSSEINALGKMRKRFHQFLDDAFNVIGKKESEGDESRTKSAKVSLTHHVETKEISRPFTSSAIIREETLESPRPKSASIGGPKRAWTASTEQRCHSATSRASAKSRAGPSRSHGAQMLVEARIASDDEPDQNSSSLSAIQTPSSDGNRSYVSSIAPLFPRYPIYPDIPYPSADTERPSTAAEGGDPAVPLISAIKEEIKRFERLKSTEQKEFHTRWST